ncbi:MAG: M20/M25/M40 family metallo-hydrolase, partial [Chloroflexota bacterium]
ERSGAIGAGATSSGDRYMIETPAKTQAEESVRYLRDLLRFDTTNPPGNETRAVQYLAGVLRSEGYDPQVIESAPGRGNVVARFPGTGELEPFLVFVHVDVVTAESACWSHDPFSGDIADGCIWGRGAMDVKCMVGQGLMAMLALQRDQVKLRRDVIFAVTADEENGGKAGMGYLVEHHPNLIRAEYGLSEGGGTTIFLGGRPFYDIRISEKGTCRFKVRARGSAGHGSVPRPDSAVGRLAEAVHKLNVTPLPFRHLPMLEPLFRTIGESLNLPLSRRALTDANVRYIGNALPALGQYLHAITHDTAVPTGLQAGQKINVIPSVAEASVDGRYLPGQTVEGFLAEVRRVIGSGYEIEVVDESPPLLEASGGPLYDTIVRVMEKRAPDASVAPLLLSGATDAKHVSRLGTKCLGFTPVRVPEDFPVERLVHGHDERIPIEGYLWGVEVLSDIIREFCR